MEGWTSSTDRDLRHGRRVRNSSFAPCFVAGRSSRRRVQRHGGANERLQRLFIDLVALVEIDGTPGVAFEAGVEEAGRVLQRGALGEGHLHDSLVRLAGADDSGMRPHRNPSPLPLLHHFGVGLLDESSDPSERLPTPITQLLDSRIYQLRGRVSSFSFFRAALPFLHGGRRSFPSGPSLSNQLITLGPVSISGPMVRWRQVFHASRLVRARLPSWLQCWRRSLGIPAFCAATPGSGRTATSTTSSRSTRLRLPCATR